jgi:small-conductance mechanosensitive channel
MEISKLILEYIKVFIWPITIIFITLLFKNEIICLLRKVKKADLPGGISIETFPEEIKEARNLSKEIKEEEKRKEKQKRTPTIPLTESNTRMLNLGLSPSPSGLELSYYRNLIEQDPTIALAGLRIEFETMLKNLAKGFNVAINGHDGAGIIVRKLKERSAITSRQAELLNHIIKLCNAAVHGLKVTTSQAEEIFDIAEVLRDQYISWLSWGFKDK